MVMDYVTLSQAKSVDSVIQSVFGPIVDVMEKVVFFSIPVGGAQLPLVVVWLLLAGLFCTFFLRVRPIRDAAQTMHVIRGRLAKKSDPGEVTSFQAFATELAGTVGLGNIAGVAVAIGAGGPGASFWIVLAGVIGMAVKMAEATLSQMFRRVNSDGTISGGPMYYLSDGLASVGKAKLGKVLGMTYAIGFAIAAFGAGNIFQANQVALHVIEITGGSESFFSGNAWLIGVILAIPAAVVIIGGIQSISNWTSRMVPLMAVLYVVGVLTVLAVNFDKLGSAFSLIISGAFTPEGVTGGVIGVMVIGIQRALFSNVAGVGTAGFAHSATKNQNATEEGLTAAWEPFVDSVVVCTLTSLAIITTGVYQNASDEGVMMATGAFATVNQGFTYVLSLCIVIFAFSTLLSYAYYGQKAAGYVFNNSKKAEMAYKIGYLIMIVVGAAVSLDTVVRFSDAAFFFVAIPNILGIYLLAGPLRREIAGYRKATAAGKMEPAPEPEQVKMLNTD
ncbi:alanine:cation symporter family protein [Corynebacterium sp. TAE3-ERU30]|nr:alanine:cation symporter family protein [Corynebacterium sp. TAE3-ERU30]MBV7302963.1 alanine:cation symporter family protein [Corynebacterium sp. TAE3-ERU2]